jgi:hypothetical protein
VQLGHDVETIIGSAYPRFIFGGRNSAGQTGLPAAILIRGIRKTSKALRGFCHFIAMPFEQVRRLCSETTNLRDAEALLVFRRADWIRTSDPYVPNVVRYRAALLPETGWQKYRITRIYQNQRFIWPPAHICPIKNSHEPVIMFLLPHDRIYFIRPSTPDFRLQTPDFFPNPPHDGLSYETGFVEFPCRKVKRSKLVIRLTVYHFKLLVMFYKKAYLRNAGSTGMRCVHAHSIIVAKSLSCYALNNTSS